MCPDTTDLHASVWGAGMWGRRWGGGVRKAGKQREWKSVPGRGRRGGKHRQKCHLGLITCLSDSHLPLQKAGCHTVLRVTFPMNLSAWKAWGPCWVWVGQTRVRSSKASLCTQKRPWRCSRNPPLLEEAREGTEDRGGCAPAVGQKLLQAGVCSEFPGAAWGPRESSEQRGKL